MNEDIQKYIDRRIIFKGSDIKEALDSSVWFLECYQNMPDYSDMWIATCSRESLTPYWQRFQAAVLERQDNLNQAENDFIKAIQEL